MILSKKCCKNSAVWKSDIKGVGLPYRGGFLHTMITPGCSFSKLFTSTSQGSKKIPTLKPCKNATKTTKSYLAQNHHQNENEKENLVV